ncbi:MAG: virulence factor [Candidatus Polarisedimenticolia bacterium]
MRIVGPMAQVKVMYWKEIPYAVRAIGPEGQVSRQLPAPFQEAIDAAAMRSGETGAGDYSAAFRWGPAEERPGSAAAVADAVVAEIVTAWPPDRLRALDRVAEE